MPTPLTRVIEQRYFQCVYCERTFDTSELCQLHELCGHRVERATWIDPELLDDNRVESELGTSSFILILLFLRSYKHGSRNTVDCISCRMRIVANAVDATCTDADETGRCFKKRSNECVIIWDVILIICVLL